MSPGPAAPEHPAASYAKDWASTKIRAENAKTEMETAVARFEEAVAEERAAWERLTSFRDPPPPPTSPGGVIRR